MAQRGLFIHLLPLLCCFPKTWLLNKEWGSKRNISSSSSCIIFICDASDFFQILCYTFAIKKHARLQPLFSAMFVKLAGNSRRYSPIVDRRKLDISQFKQVRTRKVILSIMDNINIYVSCNMQILKSPRRHEGTNSSTCLSFFHVFKSNYFILFSTILPYVKALPLLFCFLTL